MTGLWTILRRWSKLNILGSFYVSWVSSKSTLGVLNNLPTLYSKWQIFSSDVIIKQMFPHTKSSFVTRQESIKKTPRRVYFTEMRFTLKPTYTFSEIMSPKKSQPYTMVPFKYLYNGRSPEKDKLPLTIHLGLHFCLSTVSMLILATGDSWFHYLFT